MTRCVTEALRWKNRRALRLSNGVIELTVLTGGGHIADFRRSGSALNAMWEAPWPTIEPQDFSHSTHAALYGDGPAGKLLCGYTGHALALGYFGMPNPKEAAAGLPLHGEAASSEWKVVRAESSDQFASLVLEVELPVYSLHFQREIVLRADGRSASIAETVTNRSDHASDFQWVEHATFGEPFFTKGEASLFASATLGLTWPLGYEGHALLPNSVEFRWPYVSSESGEQFDLSQPFARNGTGFIVSLLTDPGRADAFVAVHNRKHTLLAGYVFDRAQFPWIALWEENCVRADVPWNGTSRARGVEFGNSPMPLGLEQARQTGTLFGNPVLNSLAAHSNMTTRYQLFLSPVPAHWTQIRKVSQSGNALLVTGDDDEQASV